MHERELFRMVLPTMLTMPVAERGRVAEGLFAPAGATKIAPARPSGWHSSRSLSRISAFVSPARSFRGCTKMQAPPARRITFLFTTRSTSPLTATGNVWGKLGETPVQAEGHAAQETLPSTKLFRTVSFARWPDGFGSFATETPVPTPRGGLTATTVTPSTVTSTIPSPRIPLKPP